MKSGFSHGPFAKFNPSLTRKQQTQTPNPRLTMTAEKRLFFLGAEGREEDGGSIKKEASL